jgi:small-conductance mechanosensitive channel
MYIGVLRITIMETVQWVSGDLYIGQIVLVANSFVHKEPIYNYSGNFPFLWDEIKAPVQFGSNYKKETGILENFGREIEDNLQRDI